MSKIMHDFVDYISTIYKHSFKDAIIPVIEKSTQIL